MYFSIVENEEIKELREQIEDMKCCGNCKNCTFSTYTEKYICIETCNDVELKIKCDKWELDKNE